MSKASFRREKAAREIVESEDSYCMNLMLLMNEYYRPLKQMVGKSDMITAQQFKDLFLNLPDVIEFSKKVLAAFQDRLKNFDNHKTCVGDVFLKFTDMSKLYQEYVSSFDKSANVLNQLLENPEFVKWQETVAMKPEVHRMRINTLLIMPVQRVPRYTLLLRELFTKTPESHPDYAALQKAIEFATSVTTAINEAKRRVEAHERVAEIQDEMKGQIQGLVRPFRSVIYEGPGACDYNSGVRPCYMILLTDQMIVLKSKSKPKLMARLVLLNAHVTDLEQNRHSKWQFGFQISNPKKSINFFVDFDNECAKWIGFVEQAIKELPGILTKYPRDRDQLTILASKGKSESSSSSSQSCPINARVKDIITICDEVIKIQAEIMQMPIDLRTMFPQFYSQLHPDHIHRLKDRIELLGKKLAAVDKLNERAKQLVATEDAFRQVDVLVSQAMPYLEGMKIIIQKSFPKNAGAPRLPKNRDPQLLMRYILYWYVKLCESWQSVTDLSLQ